MEDAENHNPLVRDEYAGTSSMAIEMMVEEDKRLKFKVMAATVLGSAIIWFEFFTYGELDEVVFDKVFFPPLDSSSRARRYKQLAYILGFATRPIGGILFGHFGDTMGRQKMLILTLVTMGISTVGMGALPAYTTIGVASPIILIVLRCLQGLALGGEQGGAVLMMYEFASYKERGLLSAIPQVGLALGLALSSACVDFLTRLPGNDFIEFGWRIVFLASGLLVALAVWVRRSIPQTPQFLSVMGDHRLLRFPLWAVFRDHARDVCFGLGALWMDGVVFNTLTVWCTHHLIHELHLPVVHVMTSLMVAALIMVATIPLCGSLADKIGRRTLYTLGCLLGGVTGFFSLTLYHLASSSTNLLCIYLTTIISLSFIYPCMFATIPCLLADAFPPSCRYSGVSFIYEVSRVYGSGLSPLILSGLYQSGGKTSIMLYMLTIGLFSSMCLSFMSKPMILSRSQEVLRTPPRTVNNYKRTRKDKGEEGRGRGKEEEEEDEEKQQGIGRRRRSEEEEEVLSPLRPTSRTR